MNFSVSQISALFAWSLASPWMLVWASAIAIPLLIHLWNRRRYEEVDWAAMRFLLQAVKQNSRRIMIEQLILLAIRCAIFILLALAIADPLLRIQNETTAGALRSIQTHYVLVIDASYSMDFRTDDQSAFERAKALMSLEVEEAPAGDAFTLIEMAQPAQLIIREPAFDKEHVKLEVDNLLMSNADADLESVLAEIESVVQNARRTHPDFSRTKISFYTDLGETTWSAAETESVKARINRLAELAELEIREIGSADRGNNAIVNIAQTPARLTAEESGQASVSVRNFGATDEQQLSLELFVDGLSRGTKSVMLPAGETVNANFPLKFDFPGDHQVVVKTTPDRLPLDDVWRLTVPVESSIRALCVDGRPGEADNIKWALQPDKQLNADSATRIEVESIAVGALADADLTKFDCVFLCNVAGFQANEVERLHRFVESGGGLIVFMGDAVRIDNYNQTLFEDEQHRLLPGKLLAFSAYENHSLDPLDYQHPIVEPFRGVEKAGLLTTPIWKYVRLDTSQSPLAKTALAFQNGDPAIVEHPIGFGRVIFFASAASGRSVDQVDGEVLPWTEIHTWPSFVVLVHEMLLSAIAGDSLKQNLVVGDVLQGKLENKLQTINLEMLDPDGRSLPLTISRHQQWQSWNAGVADRVGFYEWKQSDPQPINRKYAVNLDTGESDLAQVSADQLPHQFQQSNSTSVRAEQLALPTRRSSLFQYLLMGLLGLLIFESCLSWFFGRQTAH